MSHNNFNLKSLAVNFLESGSIELRIQNEKMEYPTSFILLHSELPDFIACLKGEKYRTFRDISYYLDVSSNAMRFIRLSSSYNGQGKFEEQYFYAPFYEMVSIIHNLEMWNEKTVFESFTYTIPESKMSDYAYISRPCYTWNFRDITSGKWVYPEGKNALNSTYLESTYIEKVDYSVEDSIIRMSNNYPSLLDCLQSLARIARNNSSGIDDKITIQLSLDRIPNENYPDDYYFFISNKDNECVMSGGIIFHSGSNEYSIHT